MMARNTKKIFAGVFALSCAFLLAGCDSYESLPNNYNDKVVAHEDGSDPDIYENEMGIIYDAIASGKTDKVVEEFLLKIAKDQFGPYYDVMDGETVVTKGVKSVAASSDDEILAYIANHKKAYEYDSDESIATETYSVNQIRIDRFKAFNSFVEDEINKVFYNEISGGTYNNEASLYEEKRLAEAHYSEMYEIVGIEDDDYPWYEGYITSSLTEDNVGNYVHIDNYKDYIDRKIIPDVYKSRLLEEYILANNYSTLGRAYGRKVNVLKITHDAKNIDIADKLVQKFTDTYILDSADTETKFSTFVEYINDAWRGFKGISYESSTNTTTVEVLESTDPAYTLLTDIGLVPDTCVTGSSLGTISYFKQTQLGELLEDYKLAIAGEGNRFATSEEEAALNKFTENGAHPKEDGLLKEIVSLSKNDATQDGWFVKNGGLSDLPSDLRDRLFNINVSNAIDSFASSETKDDHRYDPAKYVRYINNNYYLTPSKSQQAVVNPRNFVVHDNSSSSFYIVNIEEAPSTSKLNRDNKDSGYIALDPAHVLKSESFAREISRVLGTRDSYKNDAYASYIELYNVTYHDSSIYDYFKSQYPELFED